MQFGKITLALSTGRAKSKIGVDFG